MQSKLQILLALLLLNVSSCSVLAQNGLVISSVIEDKKGQIQTTKLYLAEDQLLMDYSDDKERTSMIYQVSMKELTFVNHRKKEYSRFTEEDMKEMQAKMEEAQKQMEARLEEMPPAQREIFKSSIKGAFGNNEKISVTYEKEGEEIEINEWVTDKYTGYINGQRETEIFLAPFSQLNVKEADFVAMQSMYEFMKGFLEKMAANFAMQPAFTYLESTEQVPAFKEGFPVKSIYYKKGKKQSESTVKKVERTPIDADIFKIPDGYKENEINFK